MPVLRVTAAHAIDFRPGDRHEGKAGGAGASLRGRVVLWRELFPQLRGFLLQWCSRVAADIGKECW